jgi:hypothetical protein
MKTKIFTLALLAFSNVFFAQDRTTVNATSSEISDNLDLRAVASVFGDSENLEDFERRLNDPKLQLSNLDLNNDNQVDYLRVIESVEGRTHLVVIQSVLNKDVYQDVATIEVEKDRNNKIQVQVVGDVYMYGNNYIYEPVYVHVPVFYNHFWANDYRPYYSSWNWGYYPSYYYAWNPFPLFRYRHNVGLCINMNYQYNYVTYRRCQNAYTAYYDRRGNGYERENPNRSFAVRHENMGNRYDLDQTRPRTRDVALGNNPRSMNSENNSPRNTTSPRGNSTIGNNTPRTESPRAENPRANTNYGNNTPRSESPRSESPRANTNYGNSTPRSESPRSESPKANTNYGNNTPRSEFPRSESPRASSGNNTRSESPRGNNESHGSRR